MCWLTDCALCQCHRRISSCSLSSCCMQVSVEDELATDFRCATADVSTNSRPAAPSKEGVEAAGLQQEAGPSRWQPLCCALVRLAHSALKQQPDQRAGSEAGRPSDAIGSLGSAVEAAEDCCAFAHSLIGKL